MAVLSHDIIIEKALAEYQAANYESAVELWQTLDHHDLPAWASVRYSASLFAAGKTREAGEIIQQVYEYDANAVNGYALWGWIVVGQDGLTEEAEKYFQMDAAKKRLSPGFRLNYAEALAGKERITDALQQVSSAYVQASDLKNGYCRVAWKAWIQRKIISAADAAEIIMNDIWQGRIDVEWINRIACQLCRVDELRLAEDVAAESAYLVESGPERVVRSSALKRLAMVCQRMGNTEQCCHFAKRAWDVSGHIFKETEFYAQLLMQKKCDDELREIYLEAARASLSEFSEGRDDFFAAINKAYNASRAMFKRDIFVRIQSAEQMLRQCAKQANLPFEHKKREGKPLRIVFMYPSVYSESAALSNMIRLVLKYHHADEFNVSLADINPIDLYEQTNEFLLMQKFYQSMDCQVIHPSAGLSYPYSLQDLAKKIYRNKTDALVVLPTLAEHQYLALLRPATVQLAMFFGAASSIFDYGYDHALAVSEIIQKDCSRVPCSLIKGTHELVQVRPNRSLIPVRSQLGIPEKGTILVSAGRPEKFQDMRWWQMIQSLLDKRMHIHLVVIGIKTEQLPRETQTLIEQHSDRCHVISRRPDYEEIIAASDIYVDSFPQGGGITVGRAIEHEIPVVSFENNLSESYNQDEWTVATEFYSHEACVVGRNDFKRACECIIKLVDDVQFRVTCAKEIKQSWRSHVPDGKTFVAGIEEECREQILKLSNAAFAVS